MGGIGEYIARKTPPPKGIGETIARRTPPPKGIGETIARKHAAEETKKQLEQGTYKPPTPEPEYKVTGRVSHWAEGWPKTTGIEPIPSVTGLTKAELTAKIVRQTYIAREKEKGFTSGIDPTKTYQYRITTPEQWAYVHSLTTGEPTSPTAYTKGRKGREFTPYPVIISGAEILKGQTSLAEHREKQITETLRWIAEHPSETKFKVTEKGYEAGYESIIPERLDWSKYYMGKAEKLPPVAKEVAKFGFGLTSSLYSLAGGAASLFGKRKEFEQLTTVGISAAFHHPAFEPKEFGETLATGLGKGKYGIHYVSPLDVPFEPLGLSPEGSAAFATKDPWFLAGGIAGEAVQIYAFTQATKGIKVGAVGTTKFGVKRIPGIYTKFTKVFPEEKVVTGFGKRIATTQFGKTIYRWGAKGYVPGKSFVQAGTKTFEKGGLTYKETLFKPERFGRVWMSPKEVAKFESKLAASKTLEIGFPTARTFAGVGKAEMVVDLTAYKIGFRKVIRTYGFAVTEKQIGVRFPAYSYRLTPIITKEAGVQPTKTAWYQEVIAHYGLPKQPYLRPGFIIEKEWHKVALGAKRLPQPFLKATEAQMSLVRPVTMHRAIMYRPMMTGGMHGTKMIGETIRIPATAFSYAPATMAATARASVSLSALRFGQLQEAVLEQKELTIPKFDVGRVSLSLTEPAQAYALESESALANIQVTGQTLLQQQLRLQVQAQAQAYKLVTIQLPRYVRETRVVPIPHPYRYALPRFKPFIFAFDEAGETRKKKLPGFAKRDIGYRYHKWPTMKIEDIIPDTNREIKRILKGGNR